MPFLQSCCSSALIPKMLSLSSGALPALSALVSLYTKLSLNNVTLVLNSFLCIIQSKIRSNLCLSSFILFSVEQILLIICSDDEHLKINAFSCEKWHASCRKIERLIIQVQVNQVNHKIGLFFMIKIC